MCDASQLPPDRLVWCVEPDVTHQTSWLGNTGDTDNVEEALSQ